MKKIADEKKRAVLQSFQSNPEKPFEEVSKESGISRVTILHWYQRHLIGDETWAVPGQQGFRHYDEKTKRAAVQDYLAGEHDVTILTARYHIKSASTVLNWVREYKHRIDDGTPLLKSKGGIHHMEHRDIEKMSDREIKVENVFLRAYIEELLKEVPDSKKNFYSSDWKNEYSEKFQNKHKRNLEMHTIPFKLLLLQM